MVVRRAIYAILTRKGQWNVPLDHERKPNGPVSVFWDPSVYCIYKRKV